MAYTPPKPHPFFLNDLYRLEQITSMADFCGVQMMFVSGETAEPTPETTMVVESIVQQQVMEMVIHCQDVLLLHG